MSSVGSTTFRRVAPSEVPWDELDTFADRSIFQTRPWIDFLVESQNAEPLVAEIRRGRSTVGWFTGAIVRRFGVKVLGSPLRGWTTSYMGCNLVEPDDRRAAIAALPRFAFRDLQCAHVEVMDRHLPHRDIPADAGFVTDRLRGFELALADDATMLATMTKNGRRDVRRALRNGNEVDVVDPLSDRSFVTDYYEQVTEAFAKRGRAPTYPRSRVESMVRHLAPSGNLLALRATDPEGRPAATGIFPGLAGHTAVFWMGASRRDAQPLLPNEALMWAALQTWRDRGAIRFDFGGHGAYKAKYGGTPIDVPWVRRSRVAAAERVRHLAARSSLRAQHRGHR